jgi:hypothetical protein
VVHVYWCHRVGFVSQIVGYSDQRSNKCGRVWKDTQGNGITLGGVDREGCKQRKRTAAKVLTPIQGGWQSAGSEFTSIGPLWRERRAPGPTRPRSANADAIIDIY